MKKPIKVLLIILAAVFFGGAGYLFYIQYKINRGDLFEYEGVWYTKEQARELFGPQYYEVESKNTPEEVYVAFREALLRNDKEGALLLMREDKREEYRNAFENKEKFDNWVKRFPESIIKDHVYSNNASYHYLNDADANDREAHPTLFEKNKMGYWEIYGI
ncbi:hypothetical protein A2303_04850 [Candidatus Falkowbacteria bacterium RIFOXYB2_FULL_47_14]|uniref:Uncharacterized protein n=1 Tax=Candidatus Falkowbacteria bacterium RIFOXYA2_FULL_47_19 TaxID=1797994 RepID=A0A1F5SHC6_9BACT|nr:MAG: hypothetical protein A2227_02685 [Candidatus Falkowbacteria bacterium RIFOXYA2_FULL_47_19]OGF35830.1 MAG: hypothetical protein A2468_03870 [Candidatus Falkowbacteria bacterium RIFOXYC2_FULL_46_15]OGF42703.1 MAG: hypothetical protein A2303_04850 [Candidatus Falkowbacteria bacterium RIFOXYB2_FULL_47_14]